MSAFWLTYSVWLLGEIYIWLRDRPISGAATADDKGSRVGIVFAMIVNITAAFVLTRADQDARHGLSEIVYGRALSARPLLA